MASNLNQDDMARLKGFIEACKKCPDLLHDPQISFFKEFIESLGGVIPPPTQKNSTTADSEPTPAPQPETKPDEPQEEQESDVELDNSGVIEPESEALPEIVSFDAAKEISEEAMDQSSEKRSAAMAALSDGNFDEAISAFTEAIKLNPSSAALYAKRANALLKKNRVQAVIQDCTQAISINPDSAVAYKLRGRAYRLLGKWLEAAKDLRLACKLDCDEQAIEWLAEVQPNATKLEEHERKKQRKKLEKEAKARKERVLNAKKAQEEARKKAEEEMGRGGMPGGMGGMFGGMGGGAPGGGAGGMPDLSGLASDPDLLEAFSDPEVAAAFQDVNSNPANIFKYKDNPKVAAVINKVMQKFGGGMPGMGGMPGGMPGGMGGMPGGMGGMPGGMGGMPGFGGMGGGFTAPDDKSSQPPSNDDLD